MATNKLVSVIIPCYNAGDYIAETLESVIAQTHTSWECIVVDDHSTDNSWQIIKEYQNRFPEKIFGYKNPKKGACAARNTGKALAKGEFIHYLDADDIIANKNSYAIALEFFYRNPTCAILHGIESTYNNDFSVKNFVSERGDPIRSFTEFINFFPTTGNIIEQKKLIEEKFSWNEDLQNGQEFAYLFNLYMNNVLFKYNENLALVSKRNHKSDDRITNLSFLKRIESSIVLNNTLLDIVNETKYEFKKDAYIFIAANIFKYYKYTFHITDKYKRVHLRQQLNDLLALPYLNLRCCITFKKQLFERWPHFYLRVERLYDFFHLFLHNKKRKLKKWWDNKKSYTSNRQYNK